MLKMGIVIIPELELLVQQEGFNQVQYHLDDVHRHQEWKRKNQKKKKSTKRNKKN